MSESTTAPALREELKENKAGVVRTVIAGALMGIANIIPGVSGGTIVLALGLYEQFVEAVADVTRLRFRMRSIVFLAILAVAAVVAIGLMASPINWGLMNHHHVMFALFIGLTLGGVPVVWREMHGVTPAAIAGAVCGLIVMLGVLYLKFMQLQLPAVWIVFLLAGIVAAAAMVLPGISGSYLLLVAGLYLPITLAIEQFKDALTSGDFATVWSVGWGVGAPVALGVAIGIAGLTNLLKALLARYHAPTLGALLGLLVGSVFGLYPFSPLMEKGELLAAPHAVTAGNVVLVVLAAAAGFAITVGVSRLGGEKASEGRGI